MPKAQKDHVCSLCHKQIPKGETYIYETLTPWCHQDNESFGAYKAHANCDKTWRDGVGEDLEYRFPTSGQEWREALGEQT